MGENHSLDARNGDFAAMAQAIILGPRFGMCGNAATRRAPDARELIPSLALFCACIASHCILLTSGAADAAPLVSIPAADCGVTTENIDD